MSTWEEKSSQRLHRDIVCSSMLSSSYLQQLYKRGLLPALFIFSISLESLFSFSFSPNGSKLRSFLKSHTTTHFMSLFTFWFLTAGLSRFLIIKQQYSPCRNMHETKKLSLIIFIKKTFSLSKPSTKVLLIFAI